MSKPAAHTHTVPKPSRRNKKSAPMTVVTAWKLASAMLGTLFLALCVLTVMLLMRQPSTSAQGPAPSASTSPAGKAVEGNDDAPRAPAGPAISFIRKDDKRGGSWRQDLGKDGYMVFSANGSGNHNAKLPAYIESITQEGGADYMWAANDDKRGLENPNGDGKRVSTCVYSDGEINFYVNAKRPVPCKMSLYCLDFDRCGRTQRMEFISEGKTLHTIELPTMAEGVWLQYAIRGSITIKVTCTGPANAVVAGLFFDDGQDRVPPKRTPPTGEPSDPSALQDGIVAELFDGLSTYAHAENKPTLRTVLPTLKLGSTPPLNPGQGLHGWPFSGAMAAIFSGFVIVEQEGTYTFFLDSDDGSKLYIDGAIVVDNDGSHPMKEVNGAKALTKGLHRIWIEYFNAGGMYGFNACMQRHGGAKEPLAAQLRYDPKE